MNVFHVATNFQTKTEGNKEISVSSNEETEILTITKTEKIAIPSIKIYFKPGFENVPIRLKLYTGNEFAFIEYTPLCLIGNRIGDAQTQEKIAWKAENQKQLLILDKDLKLEIFVKPLVVIPANSIYLVYDNYKVLE